VAKPDEPESTDFLQRDGAHIGLTLLRDAMPAGSTLAATGTRNLVAGDPWATWQVTATVPLPGGLVITVVAEADTIGAATTEAQEMLMTAGVNLTYPGEPVTAAD
jgi:hypothetical protein